LVDKIVSGMFYHNIIKMRNLVAGFPVINRGGEKS